MFSWAQRGPVDGSPLQAFTERPLSDTGTLQAFQSALARPFAENAELQHTLENIVCQLSRTAFTVPQPTPPLVDASARRVVEVPEASAVASPVPVVLSEMPEMTRQAAAATVVAPRPEGLPVDLAAAPVDASARRAVEVPEAPAVASSGPLVVPEMLEMTRQAAESTVVAPRSEGLPVDPVAAPVDASARRVVEDSAVPAGASPTPVVVPEMLEMTRQAVASTVVAPRSEELPVDPAAVPVDASARRVVEVPGAPAVASPGPLVVPEMSEMTRQAVASTVVAPRPEGLPVDLAAAPVDTSARRVVEVPDAPAVVSPAPLVVPEMPEVERQAVASTVVASRPEVHSVDPAAAPVDAPAVRRVADETELADAVVASGIRAPADFPPIEIPQAVDVAPPVTAVESGKAAFAPTEVLPTETFLEVANAVADVLLVSPGLLRGEGEMRVQLRPEVLEGSEIRIAVTGRQLAVEFIPQTSDVAVLIEQNRPQLEQHLAARFQTFALVVGVRRRRTDEVKGSVG